MSRKPKKSRAPKRTRKPPKAKKPTPLDQFIATGAKALGLKVEKAWLPSVRTHLQVTLLHGERVAAFVLPDDSEPAPVFEA